MAWNFAEEIALSFVSRGVSGVPTDTLAKEVGIESRDEREIDMLM